MRTKSSMVQIKKVLVVVPYALFFSFSDILLAVPENKSLSETLWFGIFGHLTAGHIQTIVMSIESIGFIFLFCLLFGDHISQFFCSTGVYIFTRLRKRSVWALKQIFIVYGISLMYTSVLISIKLCISIQQVVNWNIDMQTILTTITLLFTLSPVLAAVCLTVNLVSIYYGNTIGVFFAFIAVLILEAISILYFSCPINIILNPLCFNIDIIKSFPIAFLKILIEMLYLAFLSASVCCAVKNRDIFN